MRVLLIEDDEVFGDAVKTWLGLAGYTADWVRDGLSAQHALQTQDYALILLDLGLPKLSGNALLQQQRTRGNSTPIMVLTARTSLPDRVTALDIGADDYLSKPIELEELAARMRALIRRSNGRGEPQLRHREILLDPASLRVTNCGQPVELSAREFAILRVLMENIGRPVTRQTLEQNLYAWNDEVESNTVAVHIHNLRRKLGDASIHTKRGFGYIME